MGRPPIETQNPESIDVIVEGVEIIEAPPMSCRIVLVRPRDPNNIGAVARAMKNFGFSDFWVVTPHPPVWSEIVSAVNAEDILMNARLAGTLAEAIADCTLIVGTADRTRVEEKQTVYTPADLSRESVLYRERLALVFGSEKHGLTNEELSHCNRVMSIPTRHECPSMNLSQSVAVCCYELTREKAQQSISTFHPERASGGATEAALRLTLDVLRLIDFVLPGNEPGLIRRVRSTLTRLNLTRFDIEMLCGVLDRVQRGLISNGSDQAIESKIETKAESRKQR